MDKKKKEQHLVALEPIRISKKVDSAANIPYASEESVEEARNWVNEHEL